MNAFEQCRTVDQNYYGTDGESERGGVLTGLTVQMMLTS